MLQHGVTWTQVGTMKTTVDSREIAAACFATNDFLCFFIRQLFPVGEQSEDNNVFYLLSSCVSVNFDLILNRYNVYKITGLCFYYR